MHPLAEEIARFIKGGRAGEFDQTAAALFEYQYTHNEPYRRLAESLGATPSTVRSYREIPAVPAAAYKRFDLSCRPIDECLAVFHSSGTTAKQASRHYMDDSALALYEISLREGYLHAIDGPPEIWALMPTAFEAPHSSLTHMLATVGASRWFWQEPQELAEALSALREPITLFGTAFYFAGYFEQIDTPTPLPPGSIVVETGGYKGRTRELPREELYGLFNSRLGVPAERCYGEYGMCEMGSQFYSNGPDGRFTGPHWVRTRAIDPVTGEDAMQGETGLLRHCDCANFNSVIAIQTQDQGIVYEDGTFTLLGRAKDAEVRGCSLTAEDLWAAR